MRVFSSAAARRRWAALVLVGSALFVSLYFALQRYVPFLFQPAELRLWLGQFGVFAPLVFVLVQTLQVVFAPIPGQALALVGGYLFGPVDGTAYSLAGVFLGSAIAFTLAKRHGREFVEETLQEDVVARFDGFVERVGFPGLVVFVVVPGLPDDAICFLAGLTRLRLRTFMLAIVVGRSPAYVLTVYAGGELGSGQFVEGLALVALLTVLSVFGYYKQDAIRAAVRRVAVWLPR